MEQNTLYNKDVRNYLRSQSWPSGLIWEIVEFDDCLKLRLYRENINALLGEDKMHLAALVNTVLTKIRDKGIPIYTWVAPGDGKIDPRVGGELA